MHENKVDKRITKKLWIINPFWNIYIQDNYHFKDLNIKKNELIFRIQIKNKSRNDSQLKKGVQIEPKLKCGAGTQESHSALLECRLALPKC